VLYQDDHKHLPQYATRFAKIGAYRSLLQRTCRIKLGRGAASRKYKRSAAEIASGVVIGLPVSPGAPTRIVWFQMAMELPKVLSGVGSPELKICGTVGVALFSE